VILLALTWEDIFMADIDATLRQAVSLLARLRNCMLATMAGIYPDQHQALVASYGAARHLAVCLQACLQDSNDG
jgi:hypothetical protein